MHVFHDSSETVKFFPLEAKQHGRAIAPARP